MPWFRLEDSFHSHPKVLRAGNEAIGLYVRCGTYAAQHLTDGFIPEHIALLYGDETLVETLVQTKLWRRTRGGWRMPDFLDFNPSKEAVDKDRKGKAERQRRWREAQRRRVTNASSNASGDGAPTRPAPKEAGRGRTPSPGDGAAGRAHPSGSPVRAVPDWCEKCDHPNTRLVETGDGSVTHCPDCHPKVVRPA
jgi:hypothetical protein